MTCIVSYAYYYHNNASKWALRRFAEPKKILYRNRSEDVPGRPRSL